MLDAFEIIRSHHPDDAPAPAALALDFIPAVAHRTLKKFCIDAFNKTYLAAINQGLITKQEVIDLVGKDAARTLESRNRNPSLAQCRVILKSISERDPEAATGKREKWRHANPRPRDKRAHQPL